MKPSVSYLFLQPHERDLPLLSNDIRCLPILSHCGSFHSLKIFPQLHYKKLSILFFILNQGIFHLTWVAKDCTPCQTFPRGDKLSKPAGRCFLSLWTILYYFDPQEIKLMIFGFENKISFIFGNVVARGGNRAKNAPSMGLIEDESKKC